jgi:hypothetical protein
MEFVEASSAPRCRVTVKMNVRWASVAAVIPSDEPRAIVLIGLPLIAVPKRGQPQLLILAALSNSDPMLSQQPRPAVQRNRKWLPPIVELRQEPMPLRPVASLFEWLHTDTVPRNRAIQNLAVEATEPLRDLLCLICAS